VKGELGADTGAEFFGSEGFGEVIASAGLESVEHVVDFGACSEEDDGGFFGFFLGTEDATDFEAIHAWHEHIEEDEVDRLTGFANSDGLRAAIGDAEIVVGLEHADEDIEVGGDIIDEEDAGASFRHRGFERVFARVLHEVWVRSGKLREERSGLAEESGGGIEVVGLDGARERLNGIGDG